MPVSSAPRSQDKHTQPKPSTVEPPSKSETKPVEEKPTREKHAEKKPVEDKPPIPIPRPSVPKPAPPPPPPVEEKHEDEPVEDPPAAAVVSGAIAYPAPGQTRIPLWFPGNEVPDPLPLATNKLAGFPITLQFPLRTRVQDVSAHLSNKDEREVEVWLSSPEKPANPQYASSQQKTICLIAKQPLKPNRRYHVEVTARVSGEPWSAKWDFVTVSEDEIEREMAGTFLKTLNAQRRKAGLQPVVLDPERSKVCSAHARYLSINAPGNPMLNWNEEKPNLPGYSESAAALAPSACIQGGGGPVEAVTGLVDSLISRPQLLDPRLHALGLGYMPFARGGWIWVMDLERQREQGPAVAELLYPAPDQTEVPLVYPPDEVPSPIPPENKARGAGYVITAEFPSARKVTGATGKLVDDRGEVVDGLLSSPDKPAIPDYPQHAIGLLPKTPLKPATRYTVTMTAEVDGRAWERTWSFRTIAEPDRFTEDLDEKMLARVNEVRKLAGVPPVRLDADLSHGCQLHARYLSLNAKSAAAVGMAVHQEDPSLPGATPAGARAARMGVIAVQLDPQSCVDNWMATLYHRVPLLAPDLERVGFGHARMSGRKWVCVLDTGSGKTGR
jgi:uncharacterized protein YkwD